MNIAVNPIGTVKSVFHFKNGTPRQSSLCDSARGVITIEKSVFNNPEHSLMGLEEFSHAWIIFVFHKSNMHTKAKVKPPRLNGLKVGVFSSRSPYRPNNIGLSLVKIDKIEGASVHISGIDILDGTPVLDIKPYIPEYDKPKEERTEVTCEADSVVATDSVQDSFGSYNNTGVCSSITDQHQETATNGNVAHSSTKTSTHFVKAMNDLTTDQSQGNSSVITGDHKHHDSARECNDCSNSHDDCSNSQDPENRLPKGLDCSSDGAEVKENMDPISEGFYAISSALDRAGESLGRVATQKRSTVGQVMEKQLLSNPCDDNLCHSMLSDLIKSEDINILVDNLTSKPDSEQLVCIHSDELSHNNSHSPEELIVMETNLLGRVNTTVSNISFEKNQTECLEATAADNSKHFCRDSKIQTFVAPWLFNPPVSKLKVTFTSQAVKQLHCFSKQSHDFIYHLQMFSSPEEAQKSICDILQEDPRSVYRRQHFQDSLYFFAVDVLHVTCWFDEDTAQVVRVKPIALVTKLQQ